MEVEKKIDYAYIMRIIEGGEVKRKDLIKMLRRNGWILARHGANHDIYSKDGKYEAVPRHREIDEILALAIIKRRDLK